MKLHALMLIVVLGLGACVVDPITHGIPNLREVRSDYWRSGQPSDAEETWAYLREQKFTDVAKLDFYDESKESANEVEMAARYGIKVHYLAINPTSRVLWGLLSFGMTEVLRPEAETIAKINALLLEVRRDNQMGGRRKVLIHCTHGWDRTGLVSGMALVYNGDMTKDEAWAYMLSTNFHRIHWGLVREWDHFTP